MKLLPLLEEADARGCLDLVLKVVAEFNKRDSDRGWRDDAKKADQRAPSAAGPRSTDEAAGHGTATK